jgi:uracil-DNA glycosylase
MQGEAEPQLRAWVEYFRDLGIHDFYRCGEFVAPAADEAEVVRDPHTGAIEGADSSQGGVPVVAAESAEVSFEETTPAQHAVATPSAMQLMKLISFNDLAPLPGGRVTAAERAAALLAIREEIGDCTRCPLAYAGRHKIVFGDGAPTARLMFVGEGPGADEDAQGIPFVGKAGQLLNNMIGAMGLARSEVYIANIVKCRPPGNRVPEPVEANTCSQFLLRQMDVVRPEVIVALGATAAMYLLGVKQSLSSLRGRWHKCRGAKLAVTYHPAFLLRDPRQKAEAWKDLQMVMGELGLTPPARK